MIFSQEYVHLKKKETKIQNTLNNKTHQSFGYDFQTDKKKCWDQSLPRFSFGAGFESGKYLPLCYFSAKKQNIAALLIADPQ